MEMSEVYQGGESWKTGSSAVRAKQEAFVEWLLTPEKLREPSTRKDLAVLLDVTPRTLQNYANDPWVQQEVLKRGRALMRVERAQSVLDALYSRATDPENGAVGVSAARVWLDWADRVTEIVVDKDARDLSDDELMVVVQRMQEMLDER